MTEDFQAASTEQGKKFEEAVETLLLIAGWNIKDRHVRVHGVEIDIVAVDPFHVEWWIECKGSWRGTTQGSKRGDTVKKAVGVAWYLSTCPEPAPYMLVTSHYPNAGTVSHKLLERARQTGIFTDIRLVGFDVIADDAEADD